MVDNIDCNVPLLLFHHHAIQTLYIIKNHRMTEHGPPVNDPQTPVCTIVFYPITIAPLIEPPPTFVCVCINPDPQLLYIFAPWTTPVMTDGYFGSGWFWQFHHNNLVHSDLVV